MRLLIHPRTRTHTRTLAAAAAAGLLAAVLPASAAHAATGITGWTQVTHYLENSLTAGQGVATVDPAGAASYQLYRGDASIPLGVRIEGWNHVGDPDSAAGYIFDAYQSGSSSPTSKMFRVTTPSGSAYEYTHTLLPGEEYNNSFVAVSPDTQWMIAGEWDTMSHLQIYPTPILNPQTAPNGGSLALSGYVQLDHQVADVQGCDFVTATKLICSSDDSSQSLFPDPKPLLEVDLAHAPTGGDVTGHVTDLGPIPQTNSICSGSFEAEGLDYDPTTGILRVEVVQPGVCVVATTVYEYKAS
ncbi:MAG TPA: hypothetical protein VFA06_23350 [Actinocrinis sp.]|uniref:hypothetical protein n=1 Tax=Actinocrinis sp. TaxID=1920516 RepID=UPI002D703D46|nr:hypothetical protein [Actinocrinis sp.]HZU58836.1 hypothetical protein [Actinocrinis sp.]